MRFFTTTALVALIAAPALAEGWKDDYQVIAFNANGKQGVFREHKDY